MSNDSEEPVEVKQESKEILPGYKSIDEYTKEGYKVLIGAIKQSASLPSGSDWNFYNTHDAFNTILDEEKFRLLSNINFILRRNNIGGNIRFRDMDEKTELLIDANDAILERVANNIDEMNGIKKKVNDPVVIQTVSAQLPVNGSWNRPNSSTFSVNSTPSQENEHNNRPYAVRLLTGKNILRPQKFFKDKIINSSLHPWEPRIKDKPNSLKPLAIFLEQTENGEEFSHPYEYELERFTPPAEQLIKEQPLLPPSFESTPLVEITQPEEVDQLMEKLMLCKEFAVDLEHHSYRSFMGITCLMQISTRDTDYLIDTLALRDKLHILNEVFTKPTILKIFHGAEHDIQWLQRDLSLYVVNMFDTHQAAKMLGYSGRSLSYLMERFCNFAPNKQFQLADWRIRPLPDELKAYARGDTHYLIYIYQMMKNELLKKANGQNKLLMSVINQSTEICKRRYLKPMFREDSYMDFYRKCKRLFDNRQLYALKELYKWRDTLAREEDESLGYVLPNHMLLQISEVLPREMQGILACCNPIPPLVRSNLLELHKIVLRARDQPLEKTIMKEDTRARGTTKKISKVNVDSPLHCPHDLTKAQEFCDDLPTLLGNKINLVKETLYKKIPVQKQCSIYSIFNGPEKEEEEVHADAKEKLHSINFLGPFERYKLVKPYIQAEEEKLAAEVAKEREEKEKESEKASAESDTVPHTKQEVVEDNRTDEDRIESIRQHFLQLSKLPPVTKTEPESKPENVRQSLVQMGGTKKRKREESPPPPEEQADGLIVNFTTTVPDVPAETSRKRKSNEPHDGTPSKYPKTERRLSKKQKKKMQKQNRNQHSENNQDDQRQKKGRQMKQSRNVQNTKYRQDQDVQHGDHEQQVEANERLDDNNEETPQRTSRNHRNRPNMKKRLNKKTAYNNQNQGEEEFQPYDYSMVDFRQFQGGAGEAVTTQKVKNKFNFKGKKFGGQKNHSRSFSFGNPSRGQNRGNRGRGRGR